MRAPPGVKDDESERQITQGSRGKAYLLLPLRETISGYHARVPCLNSYQLNACSPTARKGSRAIVLKWADWRNASAKSGIIVFPLCQDVKNFLTKF